MNVDLSFIDAFKEQTEAFKCNLQGTLQALEQWQARVEQRLQDLEGQVVTPFVDSDTESARSPTFRDGLASSVAFHPQTASTLWQAPATPDRDRDGRGHHLSLSYTDVEAPMSPKAADAAPRPPPAARSPPASPKTARASPLKRPRADAGEGPQDVAFEDHLPIAIGAVPPTAFVRRRSSHYSVHARGRSLRDLRDRPHTPGHANRDDASESSDSDFFEKAKHDENLGHLYASYLMVTDSVKVGMAGPDGTALDTGTSAMSLGNLLLEKPAGAPDPLTVGVESPRSSGVRCGGHPHSSGDSGEMGDASSSADSAEVGRGCGCGPGGRCSSGRATHTSRADVKVEGGEMLRSKTIIPPNRVR